MLYFDSKTLNGITRLTSYEQVINEMCIGISLNDVVDRNFV